MALGHTWHSVHLALGHTWHSVHLALGHTWHSVHLALGPTWHSVTWHSVTWHSVHLALGHLALGPNTAYMVTAKDCVTPWKAVEVFQDIISLWVTEAREEYFTKLSSFMPHRLPML